jgi:hypothetical protein
MSTFLLKPLHIDIELPAHAASNRAEHFRLYPQKQKAGQSPALMLL